TRRICVQNSSPSVRDYKRKRNNVSSLAQPGTLHLSNVEVIPAVTGRKNGESLKKLMLAMAFLSLASMGWAESDRESSTDRLENSGKVLREIMSAPDKGIPEEVLEHAKCIAVVPHMV